MNDFLQQLRNNSNKRFDKSRRSYDNPQYRGHDRNNGRDRRNLTRRRSTDTEQVNALKGILTTIADGQKALLAEARRQADAQERQADALAEIAVHLNGGVPAASPAVARPAAAPSGDDAGNTPAMDRSAIVATIRSLKDAGNSYGDIALQLEKRSIPTITGKGAWRAQTVARLDKQS